MKIYNACYTFDCGPEKGNSSATAARVRKTRDFSVGLKYTSTEKKASLGKVFFISLTNVSFKINEKVSKTVLLECMQTSGSVFFTQNVHL